MESDEVAEVVIKKESEDLEETPGETTKLESITNESHETEETKDEVEEVAPINLTYSEESDGDETGPTSEMEL